GRAGDAAAGAPRGAQVHRGARRARRRRTGGARGRSPLMDLIILGVYAFCVWLVFIKFKWLPWNTGSQVIVIILPIVGLTILILLLNVFAPTSSDVRVIKYTINVVPQVRGRVVEVPVDGNQSVK